MAEGRFKNPFEAVMTGVKDFAKRKPNIPDLTDDYRLDGRTCVVTGANSGVGFAIAVQLAKRGANLIMACRSGIPEAGESVKQISGSKTVRMMPLDLTRVSSIMGFCRQLREEVGQIDVMHCNAGVATPSARRTESGQDEMFMVNYLAKFIMLRRLLEDGTIPNRALAGNPLPPDALRPRIVFTSSDSHRDSDPIDFGELGVFHPYGVNGGISRYSYYKLVLNTFATELSRRLNPEGAPVDVSVHAACPGPVNTNIARDAPWLLHVFLKGFFRIFFQSPAKAAPPLVYLASAPEEEGKTNQYLHMMVRREMDEKCYDRQMGRRLWEKTEHIVAQLNEEAMEEK